MKNAATTVKMEPVRLPRGCGWRCHALSSEPDRVRASAGWSMTSKSLKLAEALADAELSGGFDGDASAAGARKVQAGAGTGKELIDGLTGALPPAVVVEQENTARYEPVV